ncbi:hypothetical protein L345_10749, partial [Ophiophagus hannah]
ATFFLQYETAPLTRNCNASFGQGDTAWWAGQDKSSLQKFERWCGYQNESSSPSSSKNKDENCPNNLSLSNFHRGGIFACKTHPISKNENPVFTSKDNCMNFNFFVVAIVKSPTEQRSENIHRKANISIEEKQNFILSCEFELQNNTTVFAVYWFKETTPSKCLFSASNEDSYTLFNVSYDINCCIDDAFRDRRINSTTISRAEPRNQAYVVTITNSTTADNGDYICVVAAYNQGYTIKLWPQDQPSSHRGSLASDGWDNFVLVLQEKSKRKATGKSTKEVQAGEAISREDKGCQNWALSIAGKDSEWQPNVFAANAGSEMVTGKSWGPVSPNGSQKKGCQPCQSPNKRQSNEELLHPGLKSLHDIIAAKPITDKGAVTIASDSKALQPICLKAGNKPQCM